MSEFNINSIGQQSIKSGGGQTRDLRQLGADVTAQNLKKLKTYTKVIGAFKNHEKRHKFKINEITDLKDKVKEQQYKADAERIKETLSKIDSTKSLSTYKSRLSGDALKTLNERANTNDPENFGTTTVSDFTSGKGSTGNTLFSVGIRHIHGLFRTAGLTTRDENNIPKCTVQDSPHASIASGILDVSSVEELSKSISPRFLHLVDQYIANIETDIVMTVKELKICGPDGVFGFQLESPRESYLDITQNQIDEFLATVDPDQYSAGEKEGILKNLKKNQDSTTGNYKISPLQYHRMELAKLGCKIKGWYPDTLVVVGQIVQSPQPEDYNTIKNILAVTGKDICDSVNSQGGVNLAETIMHLAYAERSLERGKTIQVGGEESKVGDGHESLSNPQGVLDHSLPSKSVLEGYALREELPQIDPKKL